MWQIPRDSSIFSRGESSIDHFSLHPGLLCLEKTWVLHPHFTAFSGDTLSQNRSWKPKFSTAVELEKRGKWREMAPENSITSPSFYLLQCSRRWSQDLRRKKELWLCVVIAKRGQRDLKEWRTACAPVAVHQAGPQINIRIVQQIRYQWSSLAEDSSSDYFAGSWLLSFFLLC